MKHTIRLLNAILITAGVVHLSNLSAVTLKTQQQRQSFARQVRNNIKKKNWGAAAAGITEFEKAKLKRLVTDLNAEFANAFAAPAKTLPYDKALLKTKQGRVQASRAVKKALDAAEFDTALAGINALSRDFHRELYSAFVTAAATAEEIPPPPPMPVPAEEIPPPPPMPVPAKEIPPPPPPLPPEVAKEEEIPPAPWKDTLKIVLDSIQRKPGTMPEVAYAFSDITQKISDPSMIIDDIDMDDDTGRVWLAVNKPTSGDTFEVEKLDITPEFDTLSYTLKDQTPSERIVQFKRIKEGLAASDRKELNTYVIKIAQELEKEFNELLDDQTQAIVATLKIKTGQLKSIISLLGQQYGQRTSPLNMAEHEEALKTIEEASNNIRDLLSQARTDAKRIKGRALSTDDSELVDEILRGGRIQIIIDIIKQNVNALLEL